MTIRIAMWSGPRNISTAMMRAFESRPDAAVIDEPFYAAYLAESGLDHPMRAEVLAAQPTDWRAVVAALQTPPPGGEPIVYEKHMTHHMRAGFGLDFIDTRRNAFLIRDPALVLRSYTRKREGVTLADIGIVEQAALFDRVADRLGAAPPVIEGADVLADPRGMLETLCAALAIPFDAVMLAWRPGRRPTDGVWAPAWYDAVDRSTGFGPPPPPPTDPLPDDLQRIADAARPAYERLAKQCLAPGSERAEPISQPLIESGSTPPRASVPPSQSVV